MTNYLINLTKHLSDKTFNSPFLYDLYEEGQLCFLASKMDKVSVKLNRFANHLMRSMRATKTKEWRLIVLVELFLEDEAYQSNFRAFSILIQEILIKKVQEHGWKKPSEVIFIWADQMINDNLDNLNELQKKAIYLDKSGTPPISQSLDIHQVAEALEDKWENAKSLMGKNNPDRIDHFRKMDIQMIIHEIKEDIISFLDALIEDESALKIQGYHYINQKELNDVKSYAAEWLDNLKEEKRLWQKFSPKSWIIELFQERFSLDALSKHQQYYFFRISHEEWPDDKIGLYLFLREIIQSPEIIHNYKQNLSPNWVKVGLSKEGMKKVSSHYISALNKESFELNGIKSEMEKELHAVELFSSPPFIQADDSELEKIILNRFDCSWFREENSLSRFLAWVERMKNSLSIMEKSMPIIIQKTYRDNTEIPFNSKTIDKNEADWILQLNELEQDYTNQKNNLKNELADNHINIFDDYVNSVQERIKSLFFVRPTSMMFISSFLSLGILLAIPAWFGLKYHEVELTSPIYIGVSIIIGIILAFFVLSLFFKPLRQLLDEVHAHAVKAKTGIYNEFQRQQNYIKNIIQLRVLRLNIEGIKNLLNTLRMEKQQIEYVNKEINQHKDLIANKLRDMSMSASIETAENFDKKRKNDFLGKRFSSFPFSMVSSYLIDEKYNLIIDERPEESSSKIGSLVQQIEIREDDLFKAEGRFG
jgi:hypothetical protein